MYEMKDEEKRIAAVLRQWEESFVLFGKGHQRCVRDLGKAANLIEKLSADRDTWKRRCEAAMKELNRIADCESCENWKRSRLTDACSRCVKIGSIEGKHNYIWRGPCGENGGASDDKGTTD